MVLDVFTFPSASLDSIGMQNKYEDLVEIVVRTAHEANLSNDAMRW